MGTQCTSFGLMFLVPVNRKAPNQGNTGTKSFRTAFLGPKPLPLLAP
ncbi:hypothetical protein AAY473_011849 [Plecturocebus cupreus]